MTDRWLLFFQLFVLTVMGCIHVFAMEWHWYWQYRWLDNPVHFLGGLWVALFSLYALRRMGKIPRPFTVGASVITLSLMWEIFESAVGIPRDANYARDTAMDLVMDSLGGVVGFLLVARNRT